MSVTLPPVAAVGFFGAFADRASRRQQAVHKFLVRPRVASSASVSSPTWKSWVTVNGSTGPTAFVISGGDLLLQRLGCLAESPDLGFERGGLELAALSLKLLNDGGLARGL
jgi:hypothetical protein